MTKPEMTFEVLGKLLTEERTHIQKKKVVEEQFEQLLDLITTNLYPAIN